MAGSRTLAELGVDPAGGTILLVEPPDEALAEAGEMTPRPAVASSFMVAEPARWIVWWPGGDGIDRGVLERLHWYLSSVEGGEGWIVLDPDDDAESMDAATLREALDGSRIVEREARELASGEVAVLVVAG